MNATNWWKILLIPQNPTNVTSVDQSLLMTHNWGKQWYVTSEKLRTNNNQSKYKINPHCFPTGTTSNQVKYTSTSYKQTLTDTWKRNCCGRKYNKDNNTNYPNRGSRSNNSNDWKNRIPVSDWQPPSIHYQHVPTSHHRTIIRWFPMRKVTDNRRNGILYRMWRVWKSRYSLLLL